MFTCLNYALHHLSSSLEDLLYEAYEDLFGICHAFLNALQISSHYNMPWKAAATDTPPHTPTTHPHHTTLWPDFYQWQMITMRRASEPQSGPKLKAEADDDVCPIFNNLPMTTLMWRSLLCGSTAWPDVGLTKCRVRGIRSRLHYRCEILKTLLARCAAGGGRQNEQLLRRMRCVLKDTAQRE